LATAAAAAGLLSVAPKECVLLVKGILRPVGATMGDDPQKVRFLLKSTNIPCILMSIAQPVEEYKFMLEKSQSFFAGLR
jgi:hypothetical protein